MNWRSEGGETSYFYSHVSNLKLVHLEQYFELFLSLKIETFFCDCLEASIKLTGREVTFSVVNAKKLISLFGIILISWLFALELEQEATFTRTWLCFWKMLSKPSVHLCWFVFAFFVRQKISSASAVLAFNAFFDTDVFVMTFPIVQAIFCESCFHSKF